ncbi:CTP synthase C-terminal region-related (seleno)protein [Sorangium sp. So ce1182]|uniref:CTP synthase C-terminal region-related (seleno)protein n=1 Tax=Sorangium sp. So ce1182 TaxID=3133334 RepID=UPI003F61159E
MTLALLGDRRAGVRAHDLIPRALELAGDVASVDVHASWISTDARLDLAPFDAIWVVPGSPYVSMEGALAAIRFARETGRPFLGTCGGFQHAAIEYARDVLGLIDADHAESNPGAVLPFVAPLACSLAGASGRIRPRAGSRLHEIYGRDEAIESYFCNYGIAVEHEARLDRGPMRIAAVDDDGRVRAIEIPGHRFFVATLFQPELSAGSGEPHPIIAAFLRHATPPARIARAKPFRPVNPANE